MIRLIASLQKKNVAQQICQCKQYQPQECDLNQAFKSRDFTIHYIRTYIVTL